MIKQDKQNKQQELKQDTQQELKQDTQQELKQEEKIIHIYGQKSSNPNQIVLNPNAKQCMPTGCRIL